MPHELKSATAAAAAVAAAAANALAAAAAVAAAIAAAVLLLYIMIGPLHSSNNQLRRINIQGCSKQSALQRQDLAHKHLAHNELGSLLVMSIIAILCAPLVQAWPIIPGPSGLRERRS